MEVRILGPLEVRGSDGVLGVPGGRAASLLAFLALRPETVVSTDRLVEELWGERPPPTARTKVQGLVSTLRKRLARGLIETHPAGYLLAVDPLDVDAHRFRRLVERAAREGAAERERTLSSALDLWRGDPLEDFTYEPFAQTQIRALEELRLAAVEARIEARLALGRHREVVAELQTLLAAHPLRERLTALLMTALYRDGRQAEALAAYRSLANTLVEELAIDPSPEIRQLKIDILRQHPDLEVAPVDAAAPATPGWLAEHRKPVTVAFIDLDARAQVSDPERARADTHRARRLASDAVEAHGGKVPAFLGDTVVAVFGIPTAHEDDASRAVRAALEVGARLAGPDRAGFRAGINTGEVVTGNADPAPAGATVSLAERLQQVAGRGQILVGEATRLLLGDWAVVERVAVEDAWGPLPAAWRLVDLAPPPSSPPALVGRSDELNALQGFLKEAIVRRTAVVVEVVGEAGVGKTRLARELAASVGTAARVLEGRCPAYGTGITFWPLRELLEDALASEGVDTPEKLAARVGVPQSTVAQVAGAAGLTGDRGDPLRLFGAVGRLFTGLARRRPLVLVIEDTHWAQPTFVELLAHVGTIAGPLLVLCLTRPTDPDRSARLGPRHRVHLGPLQEEEVAELIRSRSGNRRLAEATVARIVDVAQGNPLFAEQILSALREDEQIRIPTSVEALLAARLDRLGPAERDLACSASVLGTEFSLAAVSALVPDRVRAFVERHAATLVDRGLLEPSGKVFFGSPGLRFRHVLVQSAAYRRLTRAARSRLHEAAAEWIDGQTTTDALDDLIGYHLERAHAERAVLEQADDHQDELARRAGERLGRAGLAAYDKFDLTAAESLLARAGDLLASEHPFRFRVMRRLAECFPMMGRLPEADAAFATLLEEVEDDEVALGLGLERIRNRMIAGPDPMSLAEVRIAAANAYDVYATRGEHTGMSQACYVLAAVAYRSGHAEELERIAHRGWTHARQADRREGVGILWWVSAATVMGPTPTDEAIATCEQLLEGPGREHVGVLSDLGCLYAMRGDFERARELITRSRDLLVERLRGVKRALTFVAQRAGRVEAMARHPTAAEEHLRWGLDRAVEVGERDQVARLAGSLSRLVTAGGDLAEGERLADLAWANAPTEGVFSQAGWRAARARILVARGKPAAAKGLLEEARDLVPPSLLNLRAGLLCDLARLLVAEGDSPQGRARAEQAADLYRRKGNRVGIDQARGILRSLEEI